MDHSWLEEKSIVATKWVGTPSSLVVHTMLFVVAFTLPFFGIAFDKILLIVTTIVSLEAIYLAIFIQMTVNRQEEEIKEVGADIDDIQEDVEDIQEDVEDISEDIDELQEKKDPEELSDQERSDVTLAIIENNLHKVLKEIENIKNNK